MLDSQKPDRRTLMDVLWEIQRKRRFIGAEDVAKVAHSFDISRAELEGVISFYHFYSFENTGKFTIYLDNSTIAEQKGGLEIRRAFEKVLGIPVGRVTPDGMFGLFETPCIGLSDQQPACLINFRPFIHLTRDRVKEIIADLRGGKRPSEICDRPELNIRYTPPPERTIFFKPYERFSTLSYLRDHSPVEVIDAVRESRLGGRGGAFFSTAAKWNICRETPSDAKYIIANADEGEPGTFKDRVLMQKHADLMIEGMIFAAYAVGATEGAIYLRAEYMYLKDELDALLDEYRRNGFLGKNIPAQTPFDFDIDVHLGAGAYVCGEETALIHSMEGKRGEPGTKEYFPVQRGFKDKPTVVNNVETLCTVTRIFEFGVERWLSLGTAKTPGTKVLSVSGDCDRPGIYEIEWGIGYDEFLRLVGAQNPRMVQLSGPSGVCVRVSTAPRSQNGATDATADVYLMDGREGAQISGEDLACGGSFMIFNDKRDILPILKSYSDFFVAESCGICIPCRTGNFLLNKKLKKLIDGHGEKHDLAEIDEWSTIIKTTSRCGLGQLSNNSLLAAIAKFPEVFDAALAADTDFNPAFNVETASADFDRIVREANANYE